MIGLALRGLATRKLRSSLTAIAVLLGVAMISGTYVLTDQIRSGFEDLQDSVYAGVDAEVKPKDVFGGSSFGAQHPIDARLIDRVRQVPGVAGVAGQLDAPGGLVVDGKYQDPGNSGFMVVTATPQPFDPTNNLEGRQPTGRGEIGMLRETAESNGVKLGDDVGIATREGVEPVKVVGIYDLGGVSSLGDTGVVSAPLAEVQRWFDRQGEVTSIVAAAQDGVSPEQLVRRIQSALPRDQVEVSTGRDSAEETAEDINSSIGGFLTPALLTFAGAALLVGAFIIFNTFSITVAERTREFAMLRTLGATRRQILASVATEALAIGLIASALGIALGLLFAGGLNAVFEAFGLGLPTASAELAARTIIVALIVGVGVTMVSALSPALRATRVPPVAAMRTAGEPIPGRRRRFAPYVAGTVVVLGLLLLLVGLFGSGPANSRLLSMAGGVVFLFIGVALSARWFVRPLAGGVGWPVQRLFKEPGLLARENAMRNPGRTATTAAALMVGLGLVVFVAVFAQSLKSSFTQSIDELIASDLIIRDQNFQELPGGAEGAVARTPGVAVATGIRFDSIAVNGKSKPGFVDVLNGVDPAGFSRVYRAKWLHGGSNALFAKLAGDNTLVEEQFAKSYKLGVGDTYSIRTATGARARMRVIGIYRDPQLMSGTIVNRTRFLQLTDERDPVILLADSQEGADPKKVQEAVTASLRRFPAAKVESNAEYRETFEDQLNQIVGLLYVLLAMSLVISVFGIANSLFLTIHERTRELGLLRAIGGTRGQVRLMVVNESIITAIIGGLLGSAIGVLFGFLVTQALDDLGLGFSVPVGQLVLIIVLAAMVGVVGAIAPARRSSRLNPLEALRTE